MLALTTASQHCPRGPARATRPEKITKIQTGKEVKLSSLSTNEDDIILHIENPKE